VPTTQNTFGLSMKGEVSCIALVRRTEICLAIRPGQKGFTGLFRLNVSRE